MEASSIKVADWTQYFDHIQLGVALSVLKNKPKSLSSKEYAKKIQKEVADKIAAANPDEVKKLTKALEEAEKKAAALEEKVHQLESEIATLNTIKTVIQLPTPEANIQISDCSAKLSRLKQIFLVRTLYNIAQNCSSEDFSNLVPKLSNYSVRPDLSYLETWSLRKQLNSEHFDSVLISALETATQCCLEGDGEFDKKVEILKVLVLLADLENCPESEGLGEKLAVAAESMSRLVLQSKHNYRLMKIIDIISDCKRIQLSLTGRIFEIVRGVAVDLDPVKARSESPFSKDLLAKRVSLLLCLCERILRKVASSFSAPSKQAQTEDKDLMIFWIEFLQVKARRERMVCEYEKARAVYVRLKESVKEITNLIPDNVPLLVVILAKCDGHLEMCCEMTKKSYESLIRNA